MPRLKICMRTPRTSAPFKFFKAIPSFRHFLLQKALALLPHQQYISHLLKSSSILVPRFVISANFISDIQPAKLLSNFALDYKVSNMRLTDPQLAGSSFLLLRKDITFLTIQSSDKKSMMDWKRTNDFHSQP